MDVQRINTKYREIFKELEKAKVDIFALMETKKKGQGNETVSRYINFYSGVNRVSIVKRGVSTDPRNNADGDIKYIFYNQLTEVLSGIRPRMLERIQQKITKTIDQYGENVCSRSDWGFIDFCDCHLLKIMNGFSITNEYINICVPTFTERKALQNFYRTFTDYVMQPQNSKLKIEDV